MNCFESTTQKKMFLHNYAMLSRSRLNLKSEASGNGIPNFDKVISKSAKRLKVMAHDNGTAAAYQKK